MVMTRELFFLFCTLMIAVIRLIMDIDNKKDNRPDSQS